MTDATEALPKPEDALEYLASRIIPGTTAESAGNIRRAIESLRAHLTDPGYVRVPVEPTPKMLIEGAKAARDWLSHPGPYPRSKAVYRAMLAAATGDKP